MKLPTDYTNLSIPDKKKVREEYIKKQDNKCYYCKRPLDNLPSQEVLEKKVDRTLFPKNFFIHLVHLHHSHDTNMTIGAVHGYCNAVLWQFEGE